jgi:serine/threonine protein kinase
MDENQICPGCQKPLPADVPLGLCPECLIQAGFKTGSESGGERTGFVPPSVEQMAKLFPQLEILGFIGKGGMGAVYKARQPALERFVALKILPPTVAGAAGFAERFSREARALARLVHPNIVAVYDFGQAGGLHYLIMEFVDGANLREVERAGRLAPAQALAIVPQICEALQFAHNEGIVHRDIKPENILLDKKGRVKITDFGIAKMIGQSAGKASLTGAKDVVGTPHYMAPEQIEHAALVDHRADIFSLGVVFYEMLTGELPLGKFQPPSQIVRVDVRLDEVVLHALEKEPERRYQQASEVKTQVETIATTPGGGRVSAPSGRHAAPAPSPAQLPATHFRRWKFSFYQVLAGVAFLCLLAAGIYFNFSNRSAEVKSDYMGWSWFPFGDSIEISRVVRTQNQLVVEGRYNLVSASNAVLALDIDPYRATTNKLYFRPGPLQRMRIAGGQGEFKLIDPHPLPAFPNLAKPADPLAAVRVGNGDRMVVLPRVLMYPDSNQAPFALLYFGTKSEALEASNVYPTRMPQAQARPSNALAAPPAGMLAMERNPDVLRIQLRQAEAEAVRQKSRYDTGVIPFLDFLAAQEKADVLKAELDGDEVKVAQVRLEAAQRIWQIVSQQAKAGMVTLSEAAAAQAEVEVREAELKAAQAAKAAAAGATNSAR